MSWITVGIAAATTVASMQDASNQADAMRSEADLAEAQMSFEQKILKYKEQDAIKRGRQEEVDYLTNARRAAGAQEAALAVQGVDTSSGTVSQVRYETDKRIFTDASRIRNNAWREALGYSMESAQIGLEKRISEITTEVRAQDAIFSGGLGAVAGGISTYSTLSGMKGGDPKAPKKPKTVIGGQSYTDYSNFA